MKCIRLIYSVLCISGMIMSCSKEELILLDKTPMFEDDGSPRIIARPENVIVEGELNRKIRITWPEVSKNVTSAKVVITKADFVNEITVTDFNPDIIFQSEDMEEYKVDITYFGKDESSSKTHSISVSPKDYEVNIIGENMVAEGVRGKARFSFTKLLMGEYTYTISYNYDGKDVVKQFNSGVDTVDTFVLDEIEDENHIYNFKVKINDKVFDHNSYEFTASIKPSPVPYLVISETLTAKQYYGGALLSWTNRSLRSDKVVVKYRVGGQEITRIKESDLYTDTLLILGLPSEPTNIEYYTVGIEDERTESRYTTVSGTPFIHFNTAALKSNWIVNVSSNVIGDGIGGPGLIDGVPGTYWHTPYDGSTDYPHWAAFQFPKSNLITSFSLQNRNNTTPNVYKDFDIQTSVDGVNWVTHESFSNSNRASGAMVDYSLSNPLATKYVRLYFKNSLTGHAFMNLAEVNFSAYPEN